MPKTFVRDLPYKFKQIFSMLQQSLYRFNYTSFDKLYSPEMGYLTDFSNTLL